jgi:putative transposase
MRKSYSTDVSEGQWALIEPLLPMAKGGRTGRPRRYSQREMLNAIFYILRTGCQWRNLPNDLPPYGAVWMQFCRWRNDGTLDKIHEALRAKVRNQAGQNQAPSAAILDSQSVKTTEKGGQKATTLARK